MYPSFTPLKYSSELLNDVTSDITDTGLASDYLQATSIPMSRPQTSNKQSQIPPFHQPPPQPPPPPASHKIPNSDNPNDALSLGQLRRLVNEFPKSDSLSYTFSYEDTASFEEEINEWFAYNDTEYRRLILVKDKFEKRWKKFVNKPWLECDTIDHERFLEREIASLYTSNLPKRCKSLQVILHVSLGVWNITAEVNFLKDNVEVKNRASKKQLEHIRYAIGLLAKLEGIPALFDILKNSFEKLSNNQCPEHFFQENEILFFQIEIDSIITIFYIIIEGIRNFDLELEKAKEKFTLIAPDMLEYILRITASMRWDQFNQWPKTKILLLLWKTILLVFGKVSEADSLKRDISENHQNDCDKILKTSPLDYHIFRQEIISKYPAYIPPQPLLPLEPDNYSILPPLSNRRRRANGSDILFSDDLNVNKSGASILHQSVHIATPAPSPPPSPPVGGKAGKKQNYQTNQNFPFMYPPLDYTSSSAGGKGLAGLQERLVGRKWNGSDIPKSILEAGDLFAERMRMTRALRQLWEEREKFMKFERGWDVGYDTEELELNSIEQDDGLTYEIKTTKPASLKSPKLDYGPNDNISDEILRKLELIERIYKYSLPHLQSLIIVLHKAILTGVTTFLTQSTGPFHGITGDLKETNSRVNGIQTQNRPQDPSSIQFLNTDCPDFLIEEVDTFMSREISIKAASGIILLLLKWFKVSHVLKFEYMTQLLLDSNYLPLVLKVFAHQDTEKSMRNKADSEDMSFFAFCNANVENGSAKETPVSRTKEDSEDDAVPPPIKILVDQSISLHAQDILPALTFEYGQDAGKQQISEILDSTHPSTEPNTELTTEFSWRVLFSTINLLRIMQKICKNKTHRNLLLVQYKSSNILKKLLRIPQSDLRNYTLKLFKNQVPYYGRKWRQGNMRIITAIYLHCRPELRDDWLAGCDINADVEDAVPLEQALRALTHWYNITYYPDKVGVNIKFLSSEYDFFVRELERMKTVEENPGDGDGELESNWEICD